MPAMVDAVARLCYVGDRSSVAVKQRVQKGLASHHEHARAGIKAGAATAKRGGVHSGHGGENNDDGGEPVTVMDKLTKQ